MLAGQAETEPSEDRMETIRLVRELSHLVTADLYLVADQEGLTPPQVRAVLELTEPAPMRDLAHRLACDKSQVTGLVDRLEQRGLMARRPDPRDRRIRQLVLTDAGRQLRETLRLRLYGQVPAIPNLTPAEEEDLRRLLRRALHPDG